MSASLSFVSLSVSARSRAFSAVFEHEVEESKKVSQALDSLVPSPLSIEPNV